MCFKVYQHVFPPRPTGPHDQFKLANQNADQYLSLGVLLCPYLIKDGARASRGQANGWRMFVELIIDDSMVWEIETDYGFISDGGAVDNIAILAFTFGYLKQSAPNPNGSLIVTHLPSH